MTIAITVTPESTARNLNQGVSKAVWAWGLKPLEIKWLMATYTKTPQATPIEIAYIQSAVRPCVVASMAIPIPTPIGLEIANANEYTTVVTNGLFGIILSNAIPIAIAANTLCNDIVHKFLHASPLLPN